MEINREREKKRENAKKKSEENSKKNSRENLRKNSKTYLKHFSIQLDSSNKLSLMIPPGFAHGFQVIEEDSQIIYTHSKEYNKDYEGGIRPTDTSMNIKWPLSVDGLSERDKNLPLLKDFTRNKTL